ncbi:NO signaling/Golgi transport ligand-binding domain-containing protein [Jimgerdemannia flammicorona]|uniref:Trafficking protein particle complex subunit n=1 Tax=Jimgerdemannia flammicorona TaxID=994334 RepID=A0A433Q362_9FUNG|nr:NO signaling/Golgi transport ligand-binding domain-containing protein [Jimgerdemannia flammicorona]
MDFGHVQINDPNAPAPNQRLSAASSAADSRYTRGKSTLERSLNKTKGAEVSLSAFAFMFSEMLQYAQKRVQGIQDLERKLNEFGYRVGIRMLELLVWRDKNSKRETRVLSVLYFVHTVVWKNLFGKPADSLEKSTENDDECEWLWCGAISKVTWKWGHMVRFDMISDNDPLVSRYISVPKELSQLNCNAFVAGIVEAVLDGCQFYNQQILTPFTPFPLSTPLPSPQPARVTAHTVPIDGFPFRTTILIKLDREILQREELLKP